MQAQLLYAVIAGVAAAGAVVAASAALETDTPRDRRIQALAHGTERRRRTKARRVIQERSATFLATALNLRSRLRLENVRERLIRAGLRRAGDEAIYLASHVLFPAAFGGVTAFCAFILNVPNVGTTWKALIVILALYAGVRMPETMLKRRIKNRREEIERAWPEALDLMLIQVEAGRSADQAFRRVAEDIEPRCRELSIELSLTLAELQLLDRRQAYENFSARTDIDEIKATCSALTQAHEHGTSLGEAFRILAKQSRDVRMQNAEKKAAQITSMLPVPVFIFFLAPLVVLAVMPPLIEYMKWR